MGCRYSILGSSGETSATTIVTLLALVGFIICFAFSMGPVVWTVINEMFPRPIRGRAVAIAIAVNRGSWSASSS
jgi:SP family galactose:H+ symporter-like MFS transporter